MYAAWTPEAISTMERLESSFLEDAVLSAAVAMSEVATEYILPEAQGQAPRFEGSLAADLKVGKLQRRGGHIFLRIGESGRLYDNFVPEDFGSAPQPFSYPLAMHEGAKKHRVWLYATDSKARQKLRRYRAQTTPRPLPATEEEFKRQEAQYPKDQQIRPFFYVDPAAHARRFLTDVVLAGGSPQKIVNLVMDKLRRELPDFWR